MKPEPMPCGDAARAALPPETIDSRDFAFGERYSIRAKVLARFERDGKQWERRVCKNCGGTWECLASSRAEYGSGPCRIAFLQRRQRRGLMVIDAAMRYRRNRKDKAAFGDMCQILGLFIAEDRAAGRPSW